jgi:ComEC/Rec2-related protein
LELTGRRIPFALLFGCAAIGILAGDLSVRFWSLWMIAFVPCAFIAGRSTVALAAAVACFFAVWQAQPIAFDPGRLLLEKPPNQSSNIEITVTEEPKPGGKSNFRRFVARVDRIAPAPVDGTFKALIECRVTNVEYGDRFALTGRFEPLPAPHNPGEFNYADFLYRRGVYIRFRAAVPAKRLEGRQTNPVVAAALRTRQIIQSVLTIGLEDDLATAQIIQSMVVGSRSEIPADLKALFAETGTLHLFAVSGLQVTVFASVIWGLLRLTGRSRRLAGLAVLPVILFYATVTGLTPSSLRAALMSSLLFLGISLERPGSLINVLCASGFVILLVEPQQLFQAGFQLSFSVVFAILIGVRPATEALSRIGEPDPFLPRSLWSPLDRLRRRVVNRLVEAIILSGICWIASAPILVAHFHFVTPVGLITNIVVVPVAGLVFLLGVTAILLAPFGSFVIGAVNNLNWLVTQILISALSAASLVPIPSWNVPGDVSANEGDRITILALRSGSAIHLRCGGRDWLFNTGNQSQWRYVTHRYLRYSGINALDGCFLSTDSPQHVGGVLELLEHYNTRLYLSADHPSSALPSRSIPVAPGFRHNVTTGTWFEVLSSGPEPARRRNPRRSPPIKLSIAGAETLLLPDLTRSALKQLATQSPEVVVLIGSHSVPLAEIAAVLRPQLIVSTDQEESLSAVQQLSLDRRGAVTLSWKPSHFEVDCFDGTQLRFTRRNR